MPEHGERLDFDRRESDESIGVCKYHSGISTAQTGIEKGVNGRILLMTWVCGLGMSALISVVCLIGGKISGQLDTQNSTIAVLQSKQSSNIDDVKSLKLQILEIDRRVDNLSIRVEDRVR